MSETGFLHLRFKSHDCQLFWRRRKLRLHVCLTKLIGLNVPRLLPSADDHQALIWDIQQMPRAIEDPILAYTAEGEINNVQWASTQPDWIAICYNNCLEILRV